MPLHSVLEIVDALSNAGVRWWLNGGWAVDSLLGSQTRIHEDLDVCVDIADGGEGRAIAALKPLGYEVVRSRARSGINMPIRCVMRNPAGHAIDLILVQRAGGGEPPDPETGWPVPQLVDDDVTIGQLDGRQLPTMSLAAQLSAREAFTPGRRERRDVARLCRRYGVPAPMGFEVSSNGWRVWPRAARRWLGRFRRASAVVIVVPEAVVINDAPLSLGPGMPPHVTVLYPFKRPGTLSPDDRRRLSGIAAAVGGPMRFDLASVGHFGQDAHLVVRPAKPVVDIVESMLAAWPECQPYGGRFDSVVPHVSLGMSGLSPVEVARLEQKLPIAVSAPELALLERNRRGRWRVAAAFRFSDAEGPVR
ncbi:MAG: nucleotidyltransferase domain-containing protein [Acidimicrobiales bacterium]